MKIAIGNDHAGYEYKVLLTTMLRQQGHDVFDLGADNSTEPDDYPDRASFVAKALQNQQAELGIIICGSAVGVSVAANKFKGVRAAVCHDTYSAHQCVEHDDCNILCLGERVIGTELAKEIVQHFLAASFSNEERHARRLHKIMEIENENMKA